MTSNRSSTPLVEVYRDHRIVVYPVGRWTWDAEFTPPNGLGSDWTTSPFRARSAERSLLKVKRMIDHDIKREDEWHARMELLHPDGHRPPLVHRSTP